jgi:hypothetical protein
VKKNTILSHIWSQLPSGRYYRGCDNEEHSYFACNKVKELPGPTCMNCVARMEDLRWPNKLREVYGKNGEED